jgi:hypothetical protein
MPKDTGSSEYRMNDCYEVLANSCFGQFAFPREVVEAVFTQFPPSSSVGAKLFPRMRAPLHILGPMDEPDLSWDKYYVIQSVEPLTGAYQIVCADLYVCHGAGFHRFAEAYPFFATADMSTYYSLQEFSAYEWRTNKDIIQIVRDADLIDREVEGSLIRVERVPIRCRFHIISDAGNEEVVVDFPVE